MNGTTVEVTNTDAEGRLVLADGLARRTGIGIGWVANLLGALVLLLWIVVPLAAFGLALGQTLSGAHAGAWLQQINALLKRLCRARYPDDHPHTLSGRAWLAFLDSRCPAAGLTRWMVLVEGAYRPQCRLDDKAIDGLEQAVDIWIRKHV